LWNGGESEEPAGSSAAGSQRSRERAESWSETFGRRDPLSSAKGCPEDDEEEDGRDERIRSRSGKRWEAAGRKGLAARILPDRRLRVEAGEAGPRLSGRGKWNAPKPLRGPVPPSTIRYLSRGMRGRGGLGGKGPAGAEGTPAGKVRMTGKTGNEGLKSMKTFKNAATFGTKQEKEANPERFESAAVSALF